MGENFLIVNTEMLKDKSQELINPAPYKDNKTNENNEHRGENYSLKCVEFIDLDTEDEHDQTHNNGKKCDELLFNAGGSLISPNITDKKQQLSKPDVQSVSTSPNDSFNAEVTKVNEACQLDAFKSFSSTTGNY